MPNDMSPDLLPNRAGEDTNALPLVIIPGAGGFASRKSNLARTCESHGETFLIDYPELPWHLKNLDLVSAAKAVHRQICDQMGRRPFVLAGVSLGAIVVALIIELDREGLRVEQVVGL